VATVKFKAFSDKAYIKVIRRQFFFAVSACFKELVRYIHLNPLGAKLADNLAKLDRYVGIQC